MKILLCTPVSIDSEKPGGISVWAENIREFLDAQPKETVSYDIVECDRSSNVNENTSVFKRVVLGVTDYYHIFKRIKERIRKEHYDVVHINSTASFSALKDILLVRLANGAGIKTVVHYHFGRIPKLASQNNWEWRLIKKTVSISDAVIVMDHASFQTLRQLGNGNVHLIPNPYSHVFERKAAALSGKIERTKTRVLFLGRAFRLKGIYELVEACKKISGIELRVVGPYDDVDKRELQNLCNNADWLHFIGPVAHEMVLEELMSCGVFVLPSYSEGFPNAILECMLCKTPIITTPVGAIPQMLDFNTEHPCGVCVGIKKPDEIAAAIRDIIQNEEKSKDMVERAFMKVKEEYNLWSVGKILCDTWMSTID